VGGFWRESLDFYTGAGFPAGHRRARLREEWKSWISTDSDKSLSVKSLRRNNILQVFDKDQSLPFHNADCTGSRVGGGAKSG
jgi:hypothetical protein